MNASKYTVGVYLYGILFAIVIPGCLVVWALAVGPAVALPGMRSVPFGLLFSSAGNSAIAWGVHSIRVYGKGLPMNPYPPSQLVVEGAYRYVRHPIYAGFVLLCFGVVLLSGSPGGLWIVMPLVIFGCTAIVLGYERLDLQKRFGSDLPAPFIHIPLDEEASPSIADRLSTYLLVLLPWGILYEVLANAGIPADARSSYFPFEKSWPVIEWAEPFYFSTYLFVLLAPAVAATKKALREFALQGGIATILMPFFFLCVPLIAPPRPFSPAGFWGGVLILERSLDTPANAFPSYHVFWILVAIPVFANRFPRAAIATWTLGVAIALSCLGTGMHSIVDVAGGALLYLALRNGEAVWNAVRSGAEKIANSWKEWRWGPVRVINHGAYAGIGSFIAVTVVGFLIGQQHASSFLLVALSALIVSGLWAQFVEGSPSLLRPYGYYGGVLGIVIGSVLAVPLFGTDPWLLLAAFSVAGPWVQSFGRLRCLVQGCCHGARSSAGNGIVYRHPRSRVCRLSDLGGVPVHPTPVYSILWNIPIAVVLTRLWFVHAPLSLIAGLYLILTGIGRFVEEAYRGEPQTRVLAGLRFYQWIGIVTVIAGAVVTCVRADPAEAVLHFDWLTVAAGFVFGVMTWFALGVDFPASNRRFARLV